MSLFGPPNIERLKKREKVARLLDVVEASGAGDWAEARLRAHEALMELAPSWSAETVATVLTRLARCWENGDAADRIGAVLGRNGSEGAQQGLRKLLTSQRFQSRVAAVSGLAQIPGPESQLSLVKTMLTDPSPLVRARAGAALGERGADALYVNTLGHLLRAYEMDDNPIVRNGAMRAMQEVLFADGAMVSNADTVAMVRAVIGEANE